VGNLTKRRKIGNTTKTTRSTNKGNYTTVSKSNKTGNIRNTMSYKNTKNGGEVYHTQTITNAAGTTRTVKKFGPHKKPGRKKVFKGSPTKRVSDRRRKGSYSDAQLLWLALFLGILVLFAG
jgi:hypothetical protein